MPGLGKKEEVSRRWPRMRSSMSVTGWPRGVPGMQRLGANKRDDAAGSEDPVTKPNW